MTDIEHTPSPGYREVLRTQRETANHERLQVRIEAARKAYEREGRQAIWVSIFDNRPRPHHWNRDF